MNENYFNDKYKKTNGLYLEVYILANGEYLCLVMLYPRGKKLHLFR